MQALSYFFREAVNSLWRGRRAGIVAVATIATALFVLGGFLVATFNLDRLVAQWSAAAEFSVYLHDTVTPEERDGIDRTLAGSGVVASRDPVSKTNALERFKQDFPDLASTANTLDANPFPASIEVRLRTGADPDDVGQLAAEVAKMPGVADVRYDREWIARVLATVTLVRSFGLLLAGVLVVAACLTVVNVVRLALFARLDEVRIMTLVGAPGAYIRGPFVVEGILQGGAGAVAGVVLLYAVFRAAISRYGDALTGLMGADAVHFLPSGLTILLIAGGMAVGCLGGMVASRAARGLALEG
jgi:cell division transport system permease protein